MTTEDYSFDSYRETAIDLIDREIGCRSAYDTGYSVTKTDTHHAWLEKAYP